MMRWLVLLTMLLLIVAAPVTAQEIDLGSAITGSLNDGAPRSVYAFDGMRGDVLRIGLSVTSGDLDPVLMLATAGGEIIARRDDSLGSRDLRLESVRLPQSDRYVIVIGRFGYTLGTTSGEYALSIERIGVSSESGSALRYGDSVFNAITDENPQIYYSFRGATGDVINVEMLRASGDLDPELQIVNSRGEVVAANDDSLDTLDSRIIGLVLRETDTYVIIASRFGAAAGSSRGSFALTLQAASASGVGQRVDFPLPILPDNPISASITSADTVRFYSFTGQAGDRVTISLNRTGGNLDPFLALADATGRELVVDDDGGGGQNALINSFTLPADGDYIIVATRFERAQGRTSGDYQLTLTVARGAVIPTTPTPTPDARRIEYGIPAGGVMTEERASILFSFEGRAGEIVTIAMNRVDGDLDPFVDLLDGNLRVIRSDDDSGGERNALIEAFTLPATGVYYIRATRFSGNLPTMGGFTLEVTVAS